MIELITEKGFDTLTVSDISEQAMISRATFYRHYSEELRREIYEGLNVIENWHSSSSFIALLYFVGTDLSRPLGNHEVKRT